MAQWGQLGFQDAASPLMEEILFFHDHTLVLLALLTSFLGCFSLNMLMNRYTLRFVTHGQELETVWTSLPIVVLLFLAMPSLRLLYISDEVSTPEMTIKSLGHQWYWSYEYSDFKDVEFDSYMIPTDDLTSGHYRLLDVDHRAVVPTDTSVRVLVASADVIHSWAVPSLGVKADAVPGRLNQLSFLISRPGIYYGQCSEICGANHSFMPIVLEAITPNHFLEWVNKMAQLT
uniref:cytochrome c oxidase subunit II n=1 Tax=Tristichotrochus unicus TaxID=499927 RepID=UPI00226CE96C|nr:cytochrome c oxidase subunit II [Tristichotrochus unicus]UZN92185.1 cytochrome c oxidase subunit 2 [Tristichotrochus unicus]